MGSNGSVPAKRVRINGFVDFVHRPEFQVLENTTFRKLGLFPSAGEERKTSRLLGPLERANLHPVQWSQQSRCLPRSNPYPRQARNVENLVAPRSLTPALLNAPDERLSVVTFRGRKRPRSGEEWGVAAPDRWLPSRRS
jgi:hypothetical protein